MQTHARGAVRLHRAAVGVVYLLPLTCGRVYIGQTDRCIKTRLNEHLKSLENKNHSHLAEHCRNCQCHPVWCDTNILFYHKDKITREIVEAFHIRRCADKCVSNPSIALTDKEFTFLSST